ncbi:MAG: flagellar biosynthesis protein FlhB [Gammaproteobacteria bacterium]|nr:MAG: flagellar biosynthesis protein FlhB [Gammaproteobacteria bacterium]
MKKRKLAVALKYDGVNAPKVTAKGEDELAEEILRIAKENEVHLHEDVELVKFLSTFELHDEIPETLYRVVAEIIAFAYMLKGKVPEEFNDTE